jgi:S-DNA-T family DNA segregation ATPase FtsK/SpoIIIE
MPHVLVAGTTGSGKSVSMNAMICSILYRATPDEVRFVMIDPKMLELSIYDGIPHLLMPPIIDSKKAANALRWAVREMEHRYQLLNEVGVRDIDSYNQKSNERISYIVIVVDEYADLIAVAGKDVEGYVMRLAQKARACGIHVMLATQRPSVDVITGVIKANFPVRMGFRLASSHDSKTIINRSGAEALLGKGDMLMIPPGTSDLVRVHGAYVSDKELNRVVDFWKAQGQPNYDPTLVSATEEEPEGQGMQLSEDADEKYQEAVNVVLRTRKCSTSWLQRQLGVGYNRAAKIVEQMEKDKIVGPIQNAKGEREIFGASDATDTAYP